MLPSIDLNNRSAQQAVTLPKIQRVFMWVSDKIHLRIFFFFFRKQEGSRFIHLRNIIQRSDRLQEVKYYRRMQHYL